MSASVLRNSASASCGVPKARSSGSSLCTATLDATSPPAWPPIPSATTNRLDPAYPESWLFDRTFPVWEIAALEPSKTMETAYFRSSNVVAPTLIGAPTFTGTGDDGCTRSPSCSVPFVESRSWIIHWSPHSTSRAWWLEV